MRAKLSYLSWLTGAASLFGLAVIVVGARRFSADNYHRFYAHTATGGLWLMFAGGLLALGCFYLTGRLAAPSLRQPFRYLAALSALATGIITALTVLSH